VNPSTSTVLLLRLHHQLQKDYTPSDSHKQSPTSQKEEFVSHGHSQMNESLLIIHIHEIDKKITRTV
jgi:hypothetical protein